MVSTRVRDNDVVSTRVRDNYLVTTGVRDNAVVSTRVITDSDIVFTRRFPTKDSVQKTQGQGQDCDVNKG